jgi:hypothetical protein
MKGSIHKRPRAFPDGSAVVGERNLALGRSSFKRVDNGTEIMNIDGRAAGSPVNVWNGTGGSDAGADWTRSGVGSEATAADSGSGTNGLDTGSTSQNDVFTFDNESMIDVVGTYDDLTFKLQPKAFPIGSRFRCAFLDSADVQVGNWVRIDQQVPNMDLDVWQTVTIDIAQFGLTGNVQKLRFQVRTTSGQQYYLDDIGLVASAGGGPYRFRAAPLDATEHWHMSMLVLKISGAEAGWDDTAFGTIAGGLTHGLVLRQRRLSEGDVLWKFTTRDNDELGGFFHPQDSIVWANGIMTLGFMVKPGKASVVVTDDDVLEFVVRDDLRGISKMRAYLHYGKEVVV